MIASFKTPAKINTQLHIMAKRPDGYHELCLHLIPIDCFDEIEIHESHNGLQLSQEGLEISGDSNDNLILRAAKAFEAETGMTTSYRFHLIKNIPMGAGLGGGSGNAAGVLQMLNHLHGLPCCDGTLHRLATSLGADVPFFLNPQPMEGMGIGEQLKSLEVFPKLHLVLIKPDFSISTGQAYGNCSTAPLPTTRLPVTSTDAVVSQLHNQFEVSLFESFPQLIAHQQRLRDSGALGALVSGSGSTLFGIYTDAEAQQRAFEILQSQKSGSVICAKSLSSYSYENLLTSSH